MSEEKRIDWEDLYNHEIFEGHFAKLVEEENK